MRKKSFIPDRSVLSAMFVGFFFLFVASGFMPGSFLTGAKVASVEAAAKKDCKLDGVTVKHDDKQKFFSEKSVAHDKNCGDISQERKCNDGKLSGNDKFKYASCKKDSAPLGVQATNYVYVNDKFNKEGATSPNRFSDLWTTGPCSMDPHSQTSKPGSISRSGSCIVKQEGSDSFLRFTIYPFDARNTDEEDGELGKGGGEALPRNSIENAYGYAPDKNSEENKKGWDLGGKKYLIDNNTVRYSWDFRINNISLLEPVTSPGAGVTGLWATRPLVPAAVLGQFHSQTKYTNFGNGNALSCGAAVESSSPSPGIWVTREGDNVTFTMKLKMEESLMPSYLSSAYKSGCETQYDRTGKTETSKSMCGFEVWSVTLPKSDVLNKWFTVQIDTKISAGSAGSYDLSFGRKDLSNTSAAGFKNQSFLGGAKTVLDSLPTKANACPGEPRIGVYALRYNPLYYADYANNATSLTFDDEAMRVIRDGKPKTWVSNAYKATFLSSGQDPLAAPKLIVDYDNFSITQLTPPPVATSQSWWSGLANVFSAWFGRYPAEEI